MASLNEQRANNIKRATDLSLRIYKLKSKQDRELMIRMYAGNIASLLTLKEQHSWISMLEEKVNHGKETVTS